MFDFDRVGPCLLQNRLSLGDEFNPLMFLGEGQRIGCQGHGFVVSAMLTPHPSKGQPRVDRFRSLPDDPLEKLLAFFRVSSQEAR